MTNEEINEINAAALAKIDADKAVADDSAYKKEIFRQNFSIDALLYLKYGELTRLHRFQKEEEHFGRQLVEASRKQETAKENIAVTKDEIRAIEEVIAEKQAAIKRNKVA